MAKQSVLISANWILGNISIREFVVRWCGGAGAMVQCELSLL